MANFKIRQVKSAVGALLILLMLSGCSPKRETVWIISTNDIHGAIENIPNLATLVKEYRAQDTASVFLIDAGDRWTGNPYVDMAPEAGQPIIELMNMLEFDAATFGNHEFDRGLEHLQKRTSEAEFPVVLANIHTLSSPLSQPMPYVVLQTKGGNNIAVLGLITNFINGHPDGTDEVYRGVEFPSPYETASMYSWLRNDNEIFIALTHTGDDADSVLAVNVPLFDIILGGHTHVAIQEPRIYGNTYVTQTGKGLKYAGVTRIDMKGKKIERIDNRLVRLDTVVADQLYRGLVERYYDNEELKRPIGSFSTPADRNGVANTLTDMVRRQMGTQFAFYHIGGIRVHNFPAGPVNKGDMFAIEPFESRAVKLQMTLPQIRELIINKFNDTQNPKESHREDIFPSGMTYTIVTDERGEAVDVTFNHRYPYQAGTKYTVAMSDYMYNVYRFEKTPVLETSPLVTDIMTSGFEKNSPVKPDDMARVMIRRR